MTSIRKAVLTLGCAGVLAAGAGSAASAAPLSQAAALKTHEQTQATPVRWRGGWGPGFGAGIAAGIIGSAAWAAGAPYYYGPGPYYSYYYYDDPYPYYGPRVYYGPPRYYGRHWRGRHYRHHRR